MYKYIHVGLKTNEMPVACDFPNECPMCYTKIVPIKYGDYLRKNDNLLDLLLVCPSCSKSFISRYRLIEEYISHNDNGYINSQFITAVPKEPHENKFDKCIKDLSPLFDEIYNQAIASETYNLNQLSGIGYRKALEFLLKDYCIYKNSNNNEKIKSMPLSQVITEYIDSDKIKNLAKASAWIGNDETHYIRKFENKDITDLKRFIKATVAFITYELTSDEATDLVSSK